MDAIREQGEGTESKAAAQTDGDKVVCFVSKRRVDRSQARQVRHPKEGLVWVSDELIK